MAALENLSARIEAMDWKKPYVWRLKISSSEFEALEAAVAAGGTTARQNVVYLAEWYKRCYDGGTAKPVRDFDAKALFEAADIDKANLFTTESGHATWQYSLYVLGGVAMAFECAKKNTRFLKELCWLFYEDGSGADGVRALPSALAADDANRAVAFRESIRTHGCLYEYLRAILDGFKSGALPFADEDLADEDSQVKRFLERIKRANDEVIRSKFDLEWVVGFDSYASHMTRKLRLRLRPEAVGGFNHRYLGYERVRQWGIVPEACRRLVVGVRFLLDGVTVAEPDFAKPLLDFVNTGTADAGFVAWGSEPCSRKIDAPSGRFNSLEIVVREDSGRDHVPDGEPLRIDEWLQVFRDPGAPNVWTTFPRLQQTSAVICPASCEMLDVGESETIYTKKFKARGTGVSEAYLWRFVNGVVRFKDLSGEIVTVYNRQGYDEVTFRLHDDILRYHDGCVSYAEEREDEIAESWLPIVFGRDDVLVRHYASGCKGDTVSTESLCESVEFWDGRRYRAWTGDDAPRQGRIRLRVTVKGKPETKNVYHLPFVPRRDCNKGEIVLGASVLKDEIVRDGLPTDPVVRRSVGDDNAFAGLEIWRPTTHKEIIRDGRVVQYVEDGETAEISYALKDGLTIRDFGVWGYREYDCGDIGNIYALPEFSPTGDRQLAAFESGEAVSVAAKLDAQAPGWLMVNLAMKFAKTLAEKSVYWNYRDDSSPYEIQDETVCVGNDIVFHSLRDYAGLCVRSIAPPEPDPFAFAEDSLEYDLASVFDRATEHRIYYFLMQPLREAHDRNRLSGLCDAIRARRGGALTDEDAIALKRLAEEFGFDWRKDYGIVI